MSKSAYGRDDFGFVTTERPVPRAAPVAPPIDPDPPVITGAWTWTDGAAIAWEDGQLIELSEAA